MIIKAYTNIILSILRIQKNIFLSAWYKSFSFLRQHLHSCCPFKFVVFNISRKSFFNWNYCCWNYWSEIVYKIPYRRARAWPSGRVRRASKGILHTRSEIEKKLLFTDPNLGFRSMARVCIQDTLLWSRARLA